VREQPLADQIFNLRPQPRIALTLHVAGSEEAIEPGSLGAGDGIFAVVDQIISKDSGSRRVGRLDAAAPVNQAVRLIKVDGLGDIIGNDGIVLPDFSDAIDLHGQENGNASLAQVAGQQNGGGCSPALTEQNDVGAGFLGRGEEAVAVGIEQVKNRGVGAFAVAILEDSNIGSGRKVRTNAFSELNRAMMRIVMADKTSDKADNYVGSGRGGIGRS